MRRQRGLEPTISRFAARHLNHSAITLYLNCPAIGSAPYPIPFIIGNTFYYHYYYYIIAQMIVGLIIVLCRACANDNFFQVNGLLQGVAKNKEHRVSKDT